MHIKIGDLAKRAGLTIRTLHHYDQIGLLSPSLRSENGFRLYTQDDVIRLQRIQALKQFGCSLEEIRSFLKQPQASLSDILRRQITSLDHQIKKAQTLRFRLSRLNERIEQGDPTNLPDWLTLLEVMAIYEKRFSKNELETLRKNRLSGNLDSKWRKLIARIQMLIEQNVPVTDPRAKECAHQWMRLIAKATGNDIELALKLKTLHQEEHTAQVATGITLEIGEYMKKAIKVAKVNFSENTLNKKFQPSVSPPKPTALRVAQFRAIHQILDKPLIFEDPFAGKIMGDPLPRDLSKFNEPLFRGLRTSIVIRSRLAEDEWLKSYALGLRQYVILGAGLDTFAFRHGDLNGLKIFEVDLPSTQDWKRNCLQAAGMEPPSSLIFAATDFENLSLAKHLKQAGFQAEQPAFFSWLGVTMYLDHTSICETLQFIGSCVPKTTVIFDYCVDPSQLSPRELKGFEIVSKKVAEQGESWKTFYTPDVLNNKIRSFGFSKIEDFGPEEITKRYLSERTDGLRKSGVTRIIRAEI